MSTKLLVKSDTSKEDMRKALDSVAALVVYYDEVMGLSKYAVPTTKLKEVLSAINL